MTAGSIISGGFGLVRERPRAVAAWGLVYLLLTAAMGLLMITQLGDRMVQLAGSPEAAVAAMGAMMGPMLLLNVLMFVVLIVLLTAAQRAVLQPERDRFFYMRLGMDELRMLGLGIFLVILFYIGFLVAILAAAAVAGLAAVAAGPVAGVLIGTPAMLAAFALSVWVMTRLGLAFPLTLLRGRMVLWDSWRVTRGRFWSLFGGFLGVFVLLMVIFGIAGLVTSGGYFAALMRHGLTPEGMQIAAQEQMAAQFGSVDVMTVLRWIVTSVAGTIGIAVYGGALGTAARELTDNIEEVSERFA